MIRLASPGIGHFHCEEVCRILTSGQLVQGEAVKAFERALADYTGASYSVAVSSGTAALWVALRAADVGPGNAVIVPAFTFPATVNVVELSGALPVLVDVDPDTYCMNPEEVASAIRHFRGPSRLAAILPVHEFGAPCAMDHIMALAKEAGLAVIEDAACALGTTFRGRHVGTFGDAGCFSFHPRKAITTGEGGAVVTNEPDLYAAATLLRNHGLTPRADAPSDLLLPGLNWRMTEFQAVLGSSQLKSFSDTLRVRQNMAHFYLNELAQIPELQLPRPLPGHAWQAFVVVLPRHADRSSVIRHLRALGVESTIGAYGVHMLTYYRQRYGYQPDDFPVARTLHERSLALPLHPGLDELSLQRVVDALAQVLTQ